MYNSTRPSQLRFWYSGHRKQHSPKANPIQNCVIPVLSFFFLVAKHLKMQLMQGFSMVPLYYRDKIVLVSFGGNKKEPSDKVKY
jgi:hypothetical protein